MTAPRRRVRRSSRVVFRRRRLAAVGACVALIIAAATVWNTLRSDVGGNSRVGAASGDQPRSRLVAKKLPTPLAAPISGEAAVPYRGDLLVLGGLDAANQSANGVFRLNPRTGGLASAATLPSPVHDAAAATVGQRVVVLGGGTSSSTAAVEVVGTGGNGRVVGQLPAPRSDLAAATIGGQIYVIGGYDGRTPSADVLRTSNGRTFTTAARLPVPVRYPAVATAGDTIYAFGGEMASGHPTDAIQAIGVSTGRVSVIGHLPGPLAHASAISLGGQIYVLGGTAGGRTSAMMLRFDPSKGRATPAGQLPGPVTNAAAATLGGTGYLVGGIGPSGSPLGSVIAIRRKQVASPPSGPADRPASATSDAPFQGRLLIADRGQQPVARRQRPQANPLALPGLPADAERRVLLP